MSSQYQQEKLEKKTTSIINNTNSLSKIKFKILVLLKNIYIYLYTAINDARE